MVGRKEEEEQDKLKCWCRSNCLTLASGRRNEASSLERERYISLVG